MQPFQSSTPSNFHVEWKNLTASSRLQLLNTDSVAASATVCFNTAKMDSEESGHDPCQGTMYTTFVEERPGVIRYKRYRSIDLRTNTAIRHRSILKHILRHLNRKASTPQLNSQLPPHHGCYPHPPGCSHCPTCHHRFGRQLQDVPDVLRLHFEMARYAFLHFRTFILLLDEPLTRSPGWTNSEIQGKVLQDKWNNGQYPAVDQVDKSLFKCAGQGDTLVWANGRTPCGNCVDGGPGRPDYCA